MNKYQELYCAVKPDLGSLAEPLVAHSVLLLRERDDFLPHAAVLSAEGKVSLVGAMCSTPDGFANAWHVLPMLHEGLRSMANERALLAIGVAELVNSIPGIMQMKAVRIHLEHRQEFTIDFYLPYSRNESGGPEFGKTLSVQSEPEVNAWPPSRV